MTRPQKKVPFWNGNPATIPQKGVSVKGREADTPLDKPARPCARCQRLFQPTLKRRMLCLSCLNWADEQGF